MTKNKISIVYIRIRRQNIKVIGKKSSPKGISHEHSKKN